MAASNPEDVAKASELAPNQPKMSIGDLSRGTGVKPAAPRRIAKGHLFLRNATQVKAQRITKVNIEERLRRCADWAAKMGDSWPIDLRRILWPDEKSFGIGAFVGGRRNLCVYIGLRTS